MSLKRKLGSEGQKTVHVDHVNYTYKVNAYQPQLTFTCYKVTIETV